MIIDSFTGEYAFLSNFYGKSFEFLGVTWPSAEHAYQASKTMSHIEKERILTSATPAAAKSAGRKVVLRPDWDERWKYTFMMRILRAKFEDPWMMKHLQNTGGAILVEGNTWHDNVWGVCSCTKCGSGKNMLGIFLMLIRDAL